LLPGASYVEMERSAERSFCCGAGGARMWMEENLGERINTNRTKEAVATGADQIAVGCPFCRVMLSDGLSAEQADGQAREEVEVLDVAQMLLASVKGESATRTSAAAPPAEAAPVTARSEETRAEPEAGDDTQTAETVTDTEDVGPAAKASGGSSLFDVEPEPSSVEPVETTTEAPPAGGSLFDLAAPAATTATEPTTEPTPEPEAKPAAESPSGSLFDIPAPEPEAAAEPEPEPKPKGPEAKPGSAVDLDENQSLFDL
jgi:hypothetical protein